MLTPGDPGAIDATATWTGSVVRGDDGLWRMFYTGSVWDETGNTQTVALATSTDLFTWHKREDFALAADARWYERRGTSSWPEEAWRDLWVYRGPDLRWHMLITARSRTGPVDGRSALLFSTGRETITDTRARQGPGEGRADRSHPGRPPLASEALYSGRLVRDQHGWAALLAFAMGARTGRFEGTIADPLYVSWNADRLRADVPTAPYALGFSLSTDCLRILYPLR
ncbi:MULTISPECIES: hypothetical protein [unclassified Streptomyces]|uniref:hypothetical protein n=1 Tax=unclassified Streptomyces TaxID=2593676 RepID=UPI000DD572D6|nr:MULTISPECIES: hypothetical protein [unclassified Streptomyces]QZZ25083.1 hypothetical protein A7X85_01095 [Streptomyces sp. ST1015]